MSVKTALRSVVLAVTFMTAVSLYAFAKIFRWLEALEARRPPPHDVRRCTDPTCSVCGDPKLPGGALSWKRAG